jgi:hypothetical protein
MPQLIFLLTTVLTILLCAKLGTERKMPQQKGDQEKKFQVASINNPFTIKHQGNIGPLFPSTW